MNVVDRVEELLNPRTDLVYKYTFAIGEVSGIETMDIRVNRGGNVLQFLTRTDLTEKQIDDFIKRVEREIEK